MKGLRRYEGLALAGVALLAGMAGCGRAGSGDSARSQATTSVVVKGSDTMVHLVTAWSEAYAEAAPEVEVSVTGGGSGTGIAALLNGTTDLCAASREMSPAEREQAAGQGLHLKEIEVARDGIAVIANPSNPVGTLTVEQLGKIFTGAYTNWKDVGGDDGEIIVLSRESSSGTFVFFQEHVLKKQDYTPRARLMPATSAIVQSVGADALAIGYVGLGYAVEAGAQVKMIAVKADADAPAVTPSEVAVRDGSYSISRPLFFYASEPLNQAAAGFVDFCLDEAGQKIVREAGYVPVQ